MPSNVSPQRFEPIAVDQNQPGPRMETCGFYYHLLRRALQPRAHHEFNTDRTQCQANSASPGRNVALHAEVSANPTTLQLLVSMLYVELTSTCGASRARGSPFSPTPSGTNELIDLI